MDLSHHQNLLAYILNQCQQVRKLDFQKSDVCETTRPSVKKSLQAYSASGSLEQRSYPTFKAQLMSTGHTYIRFADLIVITFKRRLPGLAETPSLTLVEK